MFDFELPPFNDGVCRDEDPDVFHQTGTGGAAAAKRICEGCPRMLECRAWILGLEARLGEKQSGVWGGLAANARPKPKRVFCRSGRHVYDGSDVKGCPECRRESEAARVRDRGPGVVRAAYSWMDEVDAPWAS
ncbi:WhiB family transcriptional regulator [Mycobacteroides chelonae]|uniref:WhiB family transcriptional regulator n=1 Tax=Mycobacteroides chelonae TaxID=1774 RepID=UPI00096A7B2B